MTQGLPPSAPPSRRRGNRNPLPQEYTPVHVIMALIGQSRRRCVTFQEMIEKQSAGLIQLHMECQQLAGLIRNDPQSLNRLGISLKATRTTLEKNKHYLEEQIQAELFLQGEFQRWLNGEPPTEFAPPPQGMVRHELGDEAPRALGYASPAQLPQRAQQPGMQPGVQPGMQGQPRMRPMPQQMQSPTRMVPQQRPQQEHHLPMPPQSVYAAYGQRPWAEQQPMPVVRFPVQQYAPPQPLPPLEGEHGEHGVAGSDDVDDRETGNRHEAPPRIPVNGPSAPAIPAGDHDDDDKSTASPS